MCFIVLLHLQLEQRTEQQKMTQFALEEKRTELLSSETRLKDLEEKYYNNTVQLQDKVTSDLRVRCVLIGWPWNQSGCCSMITLLLAGLGTNQIAI